MSITLKRLFQIGKRHNVDSGQAWGVGVSELKKFFPAHRQAKQLICI
jgi:hypothetical protein